MNSINRFEMVLVAGLVFFSSILITCAGDCAAQDISLKRFEFSSVEMGVALNVVVYCPDAATAKTSIETAVARIKECNQVFSDYSHDSEVALLHRKAGQFVEVSEPFHRLLLASRELNGSTDGAFDVTLGELTKKWRQIRRDKKLPGGDFPVQELSVSGFDKLEFDQSSRRIRFPDGMQFDFGGIAKGDAADQALQAMTGLGHRSAFVDLGGDIAVGAAPPGKDGWRIAVAPLRKGAAGQEKRFVEIANCGIATSGDTKQFVEIQGVRYSHILNPKTGLGVQRRSSVTVWAANAMMADALASAYSVMSLPNAKRHAIADGSIGLLIQEAAENESGVLETRTDLFPEIHMLDSD